MATKNKNTAKTETKTGTPTDGGLTKAAADKKQEVLEPEVMQENQNQLPVMYASKKVYEIPLQQLATCLTREISISNQLNVASVATDLRIGAGLYFAKKMIGGKFYTAWVEHNFKGDFSIRKAQYAVKAFKEFRKSQPGRQMQLPEPQEGGNFLMLADDNASPFMNSVSTWVAGRTQAELYDECNIRPIKNKGGKRYATRLVEEYQMQHPELMDKEFEMWSKEDRDAFREWHAKQLENDDSVGEAIAAAATWASINRMLYKHAVEDKTYAHLTETQRNEHADVIELALKNLRPKTTGKK